MPQLKQNKKVRLNENDLVPNFPSFIADFTRVRGMRYWVGMVKFEWSIILIGLLGRGGYSYFTNTYKCQFTSVSSQLITAVRKLKVRFFFQISFT